MDIEKLEIMNEMNWIKYNKIGNKKSSEDERVQQYFRKHAKGQAVQSRSRTNKSKQSSIDKLDLPSKSQPLPKGLDIQAVLAIGKNERHTKDNKHSNKQLYRQCAASNTKVEPKNTTRQRFNHVNLNSANVSLKKSSKQDDNLLQSLNERTDDKRKISNYKKHTTSIRGNRHRKLSDLSDDEVVGGVPPASAQYMADTEDNGRIPTNFPKGEILSTPPSPIPHCSYYWSHTTDVSNKQLTPVDNQSDITDSNVSERQEEVLQTPEQQQSRLMNSVTPPRGYQGSRLVAKLSDDDSDFQNTSKQDLEYLDEFFNKTLQQENLEKSLKTSETSAIIVNSSKDERTMKSKPKSSFDLEFIRRQNTITTSKRSKSDVQSSRIGADFFTSKVYMNSSTSSFGAQKKRKPPSKNRSQLQQLDRCKISTYLDLTKKTVGCQAGGGLSNMNCGTQTSESETVTVNAGTQSDRKEFKDSEMNCDSRCPLCRINSP